MGCMNSRTDEPVTAAPAAAAKPNMARITKDLVADINFECVTDPATTYKYLTNRNQSKEMLFCEDGKGLVIDSYENAFIIQKCFEGRMSALRFSNIVLVENKSYEVDTSIGVGPMQFQIHMAYTLTEGANGGTKVRRVISKFNGPAVIADGIAKNVKTENDLMSKHCQQIKDGTMTLPEDVARIPKIKKDMVVDMNFECVTDLATSWKYFTNRVQTLEMFNGAEDGKGVVKDSMSNAWTFEKTDAEGAKSHNKFKNEVLVENK